MMIQEFNYHVNLLQAILWQYDKATNLLSLINKKQSWNNTNQEQFWNNWYNNVFNLLTANQFGLSVWSYILNVPLFLNVIPEPSDAPIWGFNAYDPSFPTLENSYLNFGNGNFSTENEIISLTLEEQRFLLRLRYFQLITNGTLENKNNVNGTTGINAFLDYLLKTSKIDFNGTIYALDGLNMTINYKIINTTFPDHVFPDELLEAIELLDLLPRPTGVEIIIDIVDEPFEYPWGFNAGSFGSYENGNENFEQGNFRPFFS